MEGETYMKRSERGSRQVLDLRLRSRRGILALLVLWFVVRMRTEGEGDKVMV